MLDEISEKSGRGKHRRFHVLDAVIRYQVLFVGASAIAYGFAYIAKRYLMNVLGVPVGLPISNLEYANTVLASAFASLVSCLFVLMPLLAITYFPLRLAGFRLAGWHSSKPLRPIPGLLVIGAVMGALLPHLMLGDLGGFDRLLVAEPESAASSQDQPSPFLLAMTFPKDVAVTRFALFGVLIVAIIILGIALQRQLMLRPKTPVIITSALAILLAYAVCLLPMSFAILFLPKDFSTVVVERASPVSPETIQRFQGQLLLTTSSDVVLYGKAINAPREGKRLLVFERSLVPVISFLGESRNVVRDHLHDNFGFPMEFCHVHAETTRNLSFWTLAAGVLISIAVLIVLTERVGKEANADESAGAKAAPIAGSAPSNDPAKPPSEEVSPDDGHWLPEFLPWITETSEEALRIVQNILENLTRSGDDIETASTTSAPTGEIWRHDMVSGISERLTHEGGFATPVLAPTGDRLAAIQDRTLVILDLDGHRLSMIAGTAAYDRVLAWSRDEEHLLTLGQDGLLRRVRLEDGYTHEILLELEQSSLETIRSLIALPRLMPSFQYLRTNKSDEGWQVIKDGRELMFAEPLFSFEGDIHDPSASASGESIVFVSTKP